MKNENHPALTVTKARNGFSVTAKATFDKSDFSWMLDICPHKFSPAPITSSEHLIDPSIMTVCAELSSIVDDELTALEHQDEFLRGPFSTTYAQVEVMNQ